MVDVEKPLQTIDEDISAFAFGPEGRIVYSVRRNVKTKLYDLSMTISGCWRRMGRSGGCCKGINLNMEARRSAMRWILFAGRPTGGSYWHGFS